MQEDITRWLAENVSEIAATIFTICCFILFLINNFKIKKQKTTVNTAVKGENISLKKYVQEEVEKVNKLKTELSNEKDRIIKENEGIRKVNAKLRKTLETQQDKIYELENLIKICALNSRELVNNGIAKIVIDKTKTKETQTEPLAIINSEAQNG